MNTGTIKWYSDSKGYGFIHDSDTNLDYFFHISDFEDNISDHKIMREGERVNFKLKTSNKGSGFQAAEIKKIK